MTWELVDEKDLVAAAALIKDAIPVCGVTEAKDLKKYTRNNAEMYRYDDRDHSVVIGFRFCNGNGLWIISQLAYSGKYDVELYRIVREIIVNFMDSHKLDQIYAIRPPDEGSPMKKFYDRIADGTYWKIEKRQEVETGKEFWILPRAGAVDIQGEKNGRDGNK